MVEMNVHRCDVKVMMRVMFLGQPRPQFAGLVIEDIGKRRKTLTGDTVIDSRSLQTQASKVAHSFGPIVIAVVAMKPASSAASSSDMLIVTRSTGPAPDREKTCMLF
jgi:hypothetical protein